MREHCEPEHADGLTKAQIITGAIALGAWVGMLMIVYFC